MKKMIYIFLAFALMLAFCPLPAYADEQPYLIIDGREIRGNVMEDTFEWDANSAILVLEGYNGGEIEYRNADGKTLQIRVYRESTVTLSDYMKIAIDTGADVSISGTAPLHLKADIKCPGGEFREFYESFTGYYTDPVFIKAGRLEINKMNVSFELTGDSKSGGVYAEKGVSIRDSKITSLSGICLFRTGSVYAVNSGFSIKGGTVFLADDFSGQNVIIDKCSFSVEKIESDWGMIYGYESVSINESKIDVKDAEDLIHSNNIILDDSEINIDSSDNNFADPGEMGITFSAREMTIRRSRIKALNQDAIFGSRIVVSDSTIEAKANVWVYEVGEGTTLFRYYHFSSWMFSVDGTEKQLVRDLTFDRTKTAKSLSIYCTHTHSGFSYRDLDDGTHWKSCRECGAKIAAEPHIFDKDGVCFCGCGEENTDGVNTEVTGETAAETEAVVPAVPEKTVSLKTVIIIAVPVVLIFAAAIIVLCKKKKHES